MFKHHKVEMRGSWSDYLILLLTGGLSNLLKIITRTPSVVSSRVLPSRRSVKRSASGSMKPSLMELSKFSHVCSPRINGLCKTRHEFLGNLNTVQPHQINLGFGHFERFQPSKVRVRFDVRQSSLFEVLDGFLIRYFGLIRS